MTSRLLDTVGSLKLTLALLCAGTVLVFVGTLAQVEMGLYAAQSAYFRSLLVWWGPKGAEWRIPILPGGYLVGGLMVINLTAALINTFSLSKTRVGLVMSHAGVILLLAGQLATDLLSVESHMRLSENQPLNYSENSRENELALVDTTDPNHDLLVSIPERTLARQNQITHPSLPFTLRVRQYYRNSQPEMRGPSAPADATNGVASLFQFVKLPPVTKMDARDVPAALIEVVDQGKSLGAWWVTPWVDENQLAQSIASQSGPAVQRALEKPQTFTLQGHTWRLALRPIRSYKPFTLELLKFTHQKYSGTDIPKDFSSRVRLRRADTGEDREVLIYMNNPLRYAGETFYQSGYDENDPRVTILQVVRNPSWLTPYLACVMVSLGLIYHFIVHLFKFTAQRRQS